jgi:hypothetical protein
MRSCSFALGHLIPPVRLFGTSCSAGFTLGRFSLPLHALKLGFVSTIPEPALQNRSRTGRSGEYTISLAAKVRSLSPGPRLEALPVLSDVNCNAIEAKPPSMSTPIVFYVLYVPVGSQLQAYCPANVRV